MSYLGKDISSISGDDDPRNTSIDDLRKSFDSLRKSQDGVRRARDHFHRSREMFRERKEELIESLRRTSEIREQIVNFAAANEAALARLERKEQQKKRDIHSQYDILRKELESALSSSLTQLTLAASDERRSFADYGSSLDDALKRFDTVRFRLQRKIETQDDLDLDVSRIRQKISELSSLEYIQDPPVSTLLVKCSALPIFQTAVDTKPSSSSLLSPSKRRRSMDVLDDDDLPSRVADESTILGRADDARSVLSDASSGTRVDREDDGKQFRQALEWTYRIEVEHLDLDRTTKGKRVGSAFLLYDSRLSKSFFVTSLDCLEKGLENVITSLDISNERGKHFYLNTSAVTTSKSFPIAFLKIPAKYASLEGFSLIDNVSALRLMPCHACGFRFPARTPSLQKSFVADVSNGRVILDDMIDREMVGGPLLTPSGRLIGVTVGRDILNERTVCHDMAAVFAEYLRIFQ